MAQEISKRTAVEQFKAYVVDRAALDGAVTDYSELQDAQLGDILGAATEDDLFAAMEKAGLTGLRDVSNGTELQINGFRFIAGSNSEFANRFGVFVIMDCQNLSNGTEMQIDTGIERIIGFLRMVETGQAGIEFPVSVVVQKDRTASGNEMVTFRKVPKRAVKSA